MLVVPNTVGLIVCEQVIIAEHTRNVTLVCPAHGGAR